MSSGVVTELNVSEITLFLIMSRALLVITI